MPVVDRVAWNHVFGEVIDPRFTTFDKRRDEVAANVVFRRLTRSVVGGEVHQHLGGEDVVTHRCQNFVGRVGQARGILGLLEELLDAVRAFADGDDAELIGFGSRSTNASDRGTKAALDVFIEHLASIDSVDVVGAEHDDVLGSFVVDQIEVLIDRIEGAGEPAGTAPHLCGNGGDVVPQLSREAPRSRDVHVEAVRLVLG